LALHALSCDARADVTPGDKPDVAVQLSPVGVEEHLRRDGAHAVAFPGLFIAPHVDLLDHDAGPTLLAEQRELFVHGLAARAAGRAELDEPSAADGRGFAGGGCFAGDLLGVLVTKHQRADDAGSHEHEHGCSRTRLGGAGGLGDLLRVSRIGHDHPTLHGSSTSCSVWFASSRRWTASWAWRERKTGSLTSSGVRLWLV